MTAEKKSSDSKTSKRVKVIGTQQYVNQNTGEVEDFQVVRMEDRDFNFHKVWMHNIIMALDLIGNQKTRLAFWIIDHLNRENQLVMTYRQIADKSGISLDTVRITMKSLIESNFLRRINQGAYCVNPEVLFKGTRNGRLNVLLQYQSLDHQETIKDAPRASESVSEAIPEPVSGSAAESATPEPEAVSDSAASGSESAAESTNAEIMDFETFCETIPLPPINEKYMRALYEKYLSGN